ncbi:MAG: nucleotidyltransferase domain-containing protein [Tissierellia bacterium]|nr:nucleotidyltransferase domain-containing protein [Tissierellia bacterium]
MMQKDILEVKANLSKHIDRFAKDYNIKLIYIFGSYAKGTNIENSDLDIAVYINGRADGFLKLDLLDELVAILDREDIDLVILNNVDPELQFQVIKYGKIIYMEDILTKVLFESRVMSIYMDMEYFRRVQYEIGHKRFLKVFEEAEDK